MTYDADTITSNAESAARDLVEHFGNTLTHDDIDTEEGQDIVREWLPDNLRAVGELPTPMQDAWWSAFHAAVESLGIDLWGGRN